MTIYAVALGHGISEIYLTEIYPQPKCEGVKPTRRTYAADSSIYEEALYAELLFNVLSDETEYTTILALFGLSDADTSPVTIRLRNKYFASTVYNGTAVLPEMGKDIGWEYFIKNVSILVRDLVEV